jgi:hypothetical protein
MAMNLSIIFMLDYEQLLFPDRSILKLISELNRSALLD